MQVYVVKVKRAAAGHIAMLLCQGLDKLKQNFVVRGAGVVLGPDPDELVQVVSAQDGRVSRQVVEVVHDDGHEQVQHLNKLKPVLKNAS